jgi:hypothetical protein
MLITPDRQQREALRGQLQMIARLLPAPSNRRIRDLRSGPAYCSYFIAADQSQIKPFSQLYSSCLKLWMGKRNFNTGHAVI